MTIYRTCAMALAVWLWASGVMVVAADDAKTPSDPKIAALIEQLGSKQFATREKAAAEISQLGLEAFDALHAAQQHDDIEIAERARYLLSSMKVVWSRTGDSGEVKRLLKDYSQQSEGDRRTRIGQLARLDGTEGLGALLRLVRYEMSTILAKEAAVAIMTRPQFADAAQRDALKAAIAAQIGPSQRDVAQWLRDYLRTLEAPAATMELWQARIAAERKALDAKAEQQTDSKIVRDLYRWQAEQFQQLGKEAEAIEAVRQMIALSDGSRVQLSEIVDWLLERKAWSVVDEVADKFAEKFKADPYLLYRLAEAQVERGEKEKGEATASDALALFPMDYKEHLLIAYQLQERGRIDWSEREYRTVIKQNEMISEFGLEARSMLAEMLHDQERDADAAATLGDVVLAMEGDDAVEDNVRGISRRRGPEEIASRMYFFAAIDHVAKKEFAKAKAALEKGAAANGEDADLIIAMFKLPNTDAAWKEQIRELISAAVADFKSEIETADKLIEGSDNEPDIELAKYLKAMNCNQFAWLVGNTEGDFEEAIRLSHKSLELRPDAAGYMDTLAHCYAAKGDLQSAVKWQAKAAKLEPHSGQITRALKKFEQALEKK